MNELIKELLPDPILDLDYDMDIYSVDYYSYINSIDRKVLYNLNYLYDLSLDLSSSEPTLPYVLFDGKLHSPESTTVSNSVPHYVCQREYRDFSLGGASYIDLIEFFEQIYKGIIYYSSGQQTEEKLLSGYYCFEIYYILIPGKRIEQLNYLVRLSLLKQNYKLIYFSANILLLYSDSIQLCPLALKIGILSNNAEIIKNCIYKYDATITDAIICEFLDNIEALNTTFSLYLCTNPLHILYLLLPGLKQANIYCLNSHIYDIDNLAYYMETLFSLTLLIENDFQDNKKPTTLYFNSAQILFFALDCFCNKYYPKFCQKCCFPVSDEICQRCYLFPGVQDFDFQRLIAECQNYNVIEKYCYFGNCERTRLLFPDNILLLYAFQQINYPLFLVKVTGLFLVRGNAAETAYILKIFAGFIKSYPDFINARQIYYIFQLGLESYSVTVQDQAMHFLIYLSDYSYYKLSTVIKLLLNSLIVISVKKINSVSAKGKIQQLNHSIYQIFYKIAIYYFLEDDEVGLSIILNLIGSSCIYLNNKFAFDFPINETMIIYTMRFLNKEQDYINEGSQKLISFSIIGVLTDLTTFSINEYLVVEIINAISLIIGYYQNGKMQYIFIFNLLHICTYYARSKKLSFDVKLLVDELLANKNIYQSELLIEGTFKLFLVCNSIDQYLIYKLLYSQNSAIKYNALWLLGKKDVYHANKYMYYIKLYLQKGKNTKNFACEYLYLSKALSCNRENDQAHDQLLLKISSHIRQDEIGNLSLYIEDLYFEALDSTKINANLSTDEYNNAMHYYKQAMQKLINYAQQLYTNNPVESIFKLKLSHLDIVLGFDLPYKSFYLLMPTLLKSRNDAVLHQAKICCHQLIYRYGRVVSWKEIFAYLSSFYETCNLGVLTWLFIYYECDINYYQIKKILHIKNDNLLCQLLFIWIYGQFEKQDEIKKWLEENYFIKEIWKRVYTGLFEKEINEIGEFICFCQQ